MRVIFHLEPSFTSMSGFENYKIYEPHYFLGERRKLFDWHKQANV